MIYLIIGQKTWLQKFVYYTKLQGLEKIKMNLKWKN